MAWACRVVHRCPGRSAAARRSSQPPAQRQRERERVGLLAVHPVQLEPGARPRARAPRRRRGAGRRDPGRRRSRSPASRTSACPAASSASRRRSASWAWRWRAVSDLAEAVAQLAVGAVARDRRLGLAGRALGRDRLEGHRHRPHHARASQQRVHEHRRDVDPWPAADPVRRVQRRRRCGSAPSARARRAATRWPRPGPSRSGSAASSAASSARAYGSNAVRSTRASWPEPSAPSTDDLGRLEALGDALGLLDQRLRRCASRPRSRYAAGSIWTAIRTSCSCAARAVAPISSR